MTSVHSSVLAGISQLSQVAVSASSDYFGVFTLKQPPVLQSQMAFSQLDPIAEERFFRVDGDIIFMEFLYPRPEDDSKILLLLLVAQDQITHAICYEWDAKEPLRQASPIVTKRLLPFEDRLPTMLIPLTKTSSFMLVTTTAMSVYKNRLDPRRQPSKYPLYVPDRESRRSPLWTRWARPLRNWLYNQKHDDIYLCREDGQIFYLGIGNEGEVENQAHLGQLCCDVDAAFDILDFGHEGGDLLVAAGNTGDGGLFVQKARDHPRCVQKFMSWTPVTDSVIVKSPSPQSPFSTDVASDRLFVCTTSSFAQGAIVELRHGIEAQIGLVVSLEELSSTRDIWTMSNGTHGGVLVLTSDPVSSLLLDLPADFGEEICAVDEAGSGLDFGSQTVAAGCTNSGIIIQVTDKAIHVGVTAEPMLGSRFEYSGGQNIAVAAVNGSASLVVAAVRDQDPIKRFTRSYIEFVDPDSQQAICEPLDVPDDNPKPWRPHGAAGEKISCILEWTPKKGNEVYHFIVIAVSMSSHEPYLYMSTSRESLMILKATDENLVLHAYDRQKHDGLSHIHIGGEMELTITSSRGGRVSILSEKEVTENDKMIPVALCEAHLSSSVTRLSSGTRHLCMPTSSQVFYGTAMNGTIYRFLTLGEKEWRLLRFLQNLCVRDPIICPFTPKRKRHRNPAGNESLEFQPSHMHVDGDILNRLLMRGSGYLMHMLVTEEFYNPSTPDTGSPQAIAERFSELSKDLLGEVLNPVEAVMKWLKRTLHMGF
ncbi:hypothetical protein BBP40_010570 [Aspergillus hancockii]|nr:hypothetical protein BBP40_010570 [Aspergillus hancockii]